MQPNCAKTAKDSKSALVFSSHDRRMWRLKTAWPDFIFWFEKLVKSGVFITYICPLTKKTSRCLSKFSEVQKFVWSLERNTCGLDWRLWNRTEGLVPVLERNSREFICSSAVAFSPKTPHFYSKFQRKYKATFSNF